MGLGLEYLGLAALAAALAGMVRPYLPGSRRIHFAIAFVMLAGGLGICRGERVHAATVQVRARRG